jgi:hypothetical protein
MWKRITSCWQFDRYGRIEQHFVGGSVETPRGRLDMKPVPASVTSLDVREILVHKNCLLYRHF